MVVSPWRAVSTKLRLLSGFFLEDSTMKNTRQPTLLPTRICKVCKKEKVLHAEFFASAGKNALLWTCRMCYNKRSRKQLRKKRSKAVPEENKTPLANDGTRFRICTMCKESLLEVTENFGWRPREKAYRSRCKRCEVIAARDYTKRNPLKCLRKSRKYTEENRDLINERKSKRRKADPIKTRRSDFTPGKYKLYADRLTVDEAPIEDENGLLLVKCTYCGRYFYPGKYFIRMRIASLEGRGTGEGRLYCSEGCKEACPIFNQISWPKGFKPISSREVDPIIRQMCLERDNYTCQKCEKTIDEIELHAHHYEGAVQQPILANDVDNTITLCRPCHIWVHSQEGCTNYDLRCEK